LTPLLAGFRHALIRSLTCSSSGNLRVNGLEAVSACHDIVSSLQNAGISATSLGPRWAPRDTRSFMKILSPRSKI
jgi:hypothetical protein